METGSKQNNFLIPAAIVIGGVFIAGAVYFGLSAGDKTAGGPGTQGAEQPSGDLERMKPVTSEDHIRGNQNARVVIVEYSDFECPFCKRFHETMKQAVSEYGDEIAWVYRHHPIDQLHSKARAEAVASECANELGGQSAFWKFTDRFFDLTPSNNQTDIDTMLPRIAREIGLDPAAFARCQKSGTYDAHIEEDVQNAAATGGAGTPWSIVVAKSGKKYPLSGAQPYEAVQQLIELALKDK